MLIYDDDDDGVTVNFIEFFKTTCVEKKKIFNIFIY